jgi:hypothetical protein
MSKPNGLQGRVLRCALLLICLWVLGFTVSIATAQDALSLSFSMPESSVTLHEPVLVEVTIENPLNENIHFDLGPERKANFRFIITDPARSTVTPSGPEEGGFRSSGDISLEPRAKYTQSLLVNEWYQFPKAGNYEIQLKVVDLAIKTVSGTVLSNQALSSSVRLQIDPPDPARLSYICQRLAESARTSSGLAKRSEDAAALSYVVDPVAIPYLATLAKTAQVEKSGMLGLARIANVYGIDQVISNLRTQDLDLEQSIRSGLECVKHCCHAED